MNEYFAATVKTIRARTGDLQGQFAQRLGVKQSAISRYEAGSLKPSARIALLLLPLAKTVFEKETLLALTPANMSTVAPTHKKAAPVSEDTWLEFEVDGLCGLCGNHGYMPTIYTVSPAGMASALPAGRFCICPTGRALKERK